MRLIVLSKSGINKVRSRQTELKVSDFSDSIKSLPPGEWVLFDLGNHEYWVGFLNPLIDEKYACAQLICPLDKSQIAEFDVESLLTKKITEAVSKRRQFKDYQNNARIVYGPSDGLPGLIIDQFENASIIQINSAGVDRHREHIKKVVSELMGTPSYFLDNAKYREKESLPTYESEEIPNISVVENDLKYEIRKEVLQKVGFYYDHRENRLQLMNLLSRLNKIPESGIDLFCYAGAWGMSALKANVKKMTFVDQGSFYDEVNSALQLNGFDQRGEFVRSDVFKYLDEKINQKESFDLILCDPPAFAKSALQKTQALEGYSKLHRKVFKLLKPQSCVAFSSCTHYVSHQEFQKNISDAALKENKKVQLVYSGNQGFDHPITSLEDRSNYIKSYFYIVE